MVDLTRHSLTIGRAASDVEEWFRPVLDRGRGAAFIDTGFLKGLFFDRDQYSATARAHFAAASGNFYTTNLVLAETVRQIAKDSGVDYPTKSFMFDKCTELMIDSGTVFVCVPPRDILLDAYQELSNARSDQPSLDLCDCLSIMVLEHAQHRRVFGFDSHFTVFGALLEPGV